MRVLLCAPDHGYPLDPTDIGTLRDRLSDALDGASVGFCMTDGAGRALNHALGEMRADYDGDIVIVPTTCFADDLQGRVIPGVLSADTVHSGRTLSARDVGVDPAMLRAAGTRIAEALATAAPDTGVDPDSTLLLVVSHGAGSSDANGNLMKMTRMIWEGLGFGWAEIAFLGGAFPSLEQSLARVGRLGFKSMVVLPYAIIGDTGIDRIPARIGDADGISALSTVACSKVLGAEQDVVETLAARVREARAGQAANVMPGVMTGVMNCQSCTYREQVLALETHPRHHYDHDDR